MDEFVVDNGSCCFVEHVDENIHDGHDHENLVKLIVCRDFWNKRHS